MKQLRKLSEVNKNASFFITADRSLIIHCGEPKQRFTYAFNLINCSLFSYLPEDIFIPDSDAIKSMYILYKFILRIGDTRELRKIITLPKDTLVPIRESLFGSNLLTSFKLATLSCILQGYTVEDFYLVCAVFSKYGLTYEDSIMYMLMLHNEDVVKLIKSLSSVKEGFDLSIDSLRSEITVKNINDFTKYATSIIYRKLRFIYEGNRLDLTDLSHELLTRAIQSYYWVRPFYTKKHALNYAFRSMSGYAMTLIHYYTRDNRARTISDGEGFTNILVDLSSHTISDGFNEDMMIDYLDQERFNVKMAS